MEMHEQTNELYHHGVKGQKWGVRRYRKKNGTLTPAGRKRQEDKLISTRQASKNAHKAVRDSYAADKARSKAGERVTVRQANKNARQARNDSFAADKAHNKAVRAERADTKGKKRLKITRVASKRRVAANLCADLMGGVVGAMAFRTLAKSTDLGLSNTAVYVAGLIGGQLGMQATHRTFFDNEPLFEYERV